MRKYIWICGTAKGTPLWMYYVRTFLQIIEGIINLFSLLFYRQVSISEGWLVKMLRHQHKLFKERIGKRNYESQGKENI